jgi:hypothetical protein
MSLTLPAGSVLREDFPGILGRNLRRFESNYQAAQILPPLDVTTDYWEYMVDNGGFGLRRGPSRRAVGADIAELKSKAGTRDTATLEEYALRDLLDRKDPMVAMGRGADAEETKMVNVAGGVLADLEAIVAAGVFNESTFPVSGSGDLVGETYGNTWDNSANDPVAELQKHIDRIRATSGAPASDILVATNYRGWSRIGNNANVSARIKGATTDAVTRRSVMAMIRNELGCETMELGSTVDTSALGAASPTFSEQWNTTYLMLTVLERGNDVARPQLGRLIYNATMPLEPEGSSNGGVPYGRLLMSYETPVRTGKEFTVLGSFLPWIHPQAALVTRLLKGI